MNTVGLSAIRIQAASSLTRKALTFAAVSVEEVQRPDTRVIYLDHGNTHLAILKKPGSDQYIIQDIKHLPPCVETENPRCYWPLNHCNLTPQPGVVYQDRSAK